MGKDIVTLDVFVVNKLELVNFCYTFYTPEWEYKSLSVGTIEKTI